VLTDPADPADPAAPAVAAGAGAPGIGVADEEAVDVRLTGAGVREQPAREQVTTATARTVNR
jgi:hypothetical protein